MQKVNQLNGISQFLRENKVDIKQITSLVAKKVSKKTIQKYMSSAKRPDCTGLCSQQFNIDMGSCENVFMFELAGAIIAGGLSGGMAGSLGFIIATASYMDCESTTFGSFDTCSQGCGL